MATPFRDIYKYFDSNLIEDELNMIENSHKRNYIRVSIPQFSQYLKAINADYDEGEIIEDLTEVEILVLAKLMYREWIKGKKQYWADVTSIITDIHKVQDVASVKRTYETLYNNNENDLNSLLSTLL